MIVTLRVKRAKKRCTTELFTKPKSCSYNLVAQQPYTPRAKSATATMKTTMHSTMISNTPAINKPIPTRPTPRSLRIRAAIAEPPAPDAAASKQPYGRVFNFSAGPAVLPLPVLEQAQADLINWQGSGQSVMEMSHRGKEFDSIAKKAEADLRALLSIPDNYKVLFMQGGASTQFAAVPLNLTEGNDDVVDYIVTGSWSKKAAQEGKKYAKVGVLVGGGERKPLPRECV